MPCADPDSAPGRQYATQLLGDLLARELGRVDRGDLLDHPARAGLTDLGHVGGGVRRVPDDKDGGALVRCQRLDGLPDLLRDTDALFDDAEEVAGVAALKTGRVLVAGLDADGDFDVVPGASVPLGVEG